MDQRIVKRLTRALSELVTLQDFIKESGLEASTVHAFKTRGRLPKPIGTVGSTPVWAREQLNDWLAARSRRAGLSAARSSVEQ